ncbi:hypothetical protein IC615_11580 [Serratia ureilytica]
MKDFTVKGIGARINNSKDETTIEYTYIDGVRFDSPEGPLGNFSVNNVYISGFYYGLYYGTNAYIAHHYACEVIRCFECLHMPSTNSGAQNFGEGINFFGGTLGNSQGWPFATLTPTAPSACSALRSTMPARLPTLRPVALNCMAAIWNSTTVIVRSRKFPSVAAPIKMHRC